LTHSERNTRCIAALLAALMVVPPAGGAEPPAAGPGIAAEQRLPDLGDASDIGIGPADEQRLGREFMRQARTQLNLLDDPVLGAYLQRIGEHIAVEAGADEGEFYFFLVNDKTFNAFAVPGGYVGVHTGLVMAARTEAQLASVLAHEIAHVRQRHIPRMIAEQKRVTGPALLAMVAGVLLASASSSSNAGQAAVALTSAALTQHQINFTRSFEEEADRLGMRALAGAGYSASAMPEMFEVMSQEGRLYESTLPEYLRTHPVTTRRISEARDRALAYKAVAGTDNTELEHAQARIRVLAAPNSHSAVEWFRAEREAGRNGDAVRYGLALALTRARDYQGAGRELGPLLAARPSYAPYVIADAENAISAGKLGAALARYDGALANNPDQPLLQRYYAEALLKAKKPREARNWLRAALRGEPRDPELYRTLSRAAGDAGNLAEAHQAYAEYYYLNGDLRRAVEQLKLAERSAGSSPYYRESIATRIRAIEAEIKSEGKRSADQGPGGGR
jgi:predicted Zn-dependent protease